MLPISLTLNKLGKVLFNVPFPSGSSGQFPDQKICHLILLAENQNCLSQSQLSFLAGTMDQYTQSRILIFGNNHLITVQNCEWIPSALDLVKFDWMEMISSNWFVSFGLVSVSFWLKWRHNKKCVLMIRKRKKKLVNGTRHVLAKE